MTPGEVAAKVSAELVAELVIKTLSALNPVQSDWKFSSFDTGGGSIDVGGIGLGLTAGTLKLKKSGQAKDNQFTCGSIDAGVGTPYPVPVNLSFSIPNTPSTGIVLRLPAAFGELTASDFRGGFCACSYSAQCGVGVGLTFLFMGAIILPNPQNIALSFITQLLMNCKALIVCAGVSGNLFPGNAGTAYSIGGSI